MSQYSGLSLLVILKADPSVLPLSEEKMNIDNILFVARKGS